MPSERTGQSDSTDAQGELEAVRDVLRAISRSPSDVEAVLGIACEHVVRLCRADFGYVFVPKGDHLRVVGASRRAPKEVLDYLRDHPIPMDRRTGVGRVMLTGKEVQIEDVDADAEWDLRDAQRLSGYRSTLSVPLRREGKVIGAFSVARVRVSRFSDHEIELVRTFADQAAIVVDSVRLLTTVQRQREELARYLPSKVAQLISSPDSSQRLAAHRSEITSVYCDLRGFTSFTSTAEPEEVISVLSAYQREMGRIVLGHDGTLEGYSGDGIMSFLNDPLPVPGHPRVGIRMALAMQDRFSELSADWERRGWELGLGIGLSSGFATVGRVGFEGYYHYTAIGNVANLAARLCSAARPGQVVISGRTLAEVEGEVEVQPLGSFELKGFSRPVEAFSVTRLVESRSSGPTG
jgi:class 3 adenylate cyclase